MVKNLAKRAMTTTGQKACYVIDHLVEALGNEPCSSLRRAQILVDIDQHPGTSQVGVMERLNIHKSALNREIEWLYDYGCIMRQGSEDDGRAVRLVTCGYSKKGLEGALDYFNNSHDDLKIFIEGMAKILKDERPTLRDAKIAAMIYNKRGISKQEIMNGLYNGAPSTDNRAISRLYEEGIIRDAS
jgi:DNA-binding MarR family transcriptional regulator